MLLRLILVLHFRTTRKYRKNVWHKSADDSLPFLLIRSIYMAQYIGLLILLFLIEAVIFNVKNKQMAIFCFTCIISVVDNITQYNNYSFKM